jgi:3-oxoadipate enol-lactonase
MLIKANGIQIHYELTGKKESPVVMLSHSLGSSLVMWNPQMDVLKTFFQVLRYDIRGHGNSEVTKGPYTLELLGEDAIGLIDSLGIDTVHWVGLSLGGMIGQCLALNHPNRLKSLSLCDTGAFIPDEAQPIWKDRIEATKKGGMESQVEATMERWFTPSYLSRNFQILALIRNQFLATSVEGYLGCIGAIRQLNYLDRLPKIKIPTLIMVGEDDPGTPVAASEAMHQRISGSKLVILPVARHFSNVEQAEAFNRHLIDFLRQN